MSPAASSRKTWKQRYDSVKCAINGWLNSKSELCSRVAGFEVSCRQAIRMGLILLATMTAAVCTVQAPLVTAGSLAVAGWLVYRLNKEEKEAGHE